MTAFTKRDRSDTFFGATVQQVWSAFYWFERIVREHRVGSMLELGTGLGATTMFFGGLFPDHVITYDIADKRTDRVKDMHRRLGVDVRLFDLFAGHALVSLHTDLESNRFENRPALIFCDGGDKHREFNLFSGLLQEGDLIACHDTGVEFFPDRSDARSTEEASGLVRLYPAELRADNTLLTVYVRPARW